MPCPAGIGGQDSQTISRIVLVATFLPLRALYKQHAELTQSSTVSLYFYLYEMEFLDINLTKDMSLFLHAIHSQSLLPADFKENHTLPWF
jgi:hypothetical protein